jgi:hypothetical protein
MTQLRLTQISVRLHALRPVELAPYPATTVRGALGTALRYQSCTTDLPTCSEGTGRARRMCNRIMACPYGRLWESAIPAWIDPSTVPASPPAPYVVATPWQLAPMQLAPGDSVPILVTLFGDARALWPNVLAALRRSARQIGPRENHGALELIEECDDVAVAHSEVALALHDLGTDFVGLELTSPLWIRAYTQPGTRVTMSAFNPTLFTEAVANRFVQLIRLYEPDMDCPDLANVIARAQQVGVVEDRTGQVAFERYSQRVDDRIPAEGIVGSVVCSDVHPTVYSVWRLAEQIHAGRNTNFGFGRVVATPLRPVGA